MDFWPDKQPKMFGWCRRYGLSSDDARDMVQDVFVRCWRAEQSGKMVLPGYAEMVLRHLFIDRLRVITRRGFLSLDALPDAGNLVPSPSVFIEAVTTDELIDQIGHMLTRGQSIAMRMRADGYSFRQIGAAVGVSEDAAKKLFYRARQRLKAKKWMAA